MTLAGALLTFAAAFAAGAVNAVAGGGTLLTFPTLVGLGMGSVVANATSTVGLVPGSLAGAWGYRDELKVVRGWIPWLLPSSFLGGGVGAFLLLVTPERVFDRVVPGLVLLATVLFAFADPVARRLNAHLGAEPKSTSRAVAVSVLQFAVAVYGGYFGAGVGIMMLAVLAFLSLGSLHEANGLKTFSVAAINAVASGIFLAKGLVQAVPAILIVAGSVGGGFLGAGLARKLGPKRVRTAVIVAGLVAAIVLARKALLA